MPDTGPRFLKACRRKPVDSTPVWFMRQAGRYLPEYRAVRRHHSILEICQNPQLAAEVTVTAAERLGVDAAIIFADLLLPVQPMGMKLRFVRGEGPVLEDPVRDAKAVLKLKTNGSAELGYVSEAIRRVHRHFAGKVPVIGFAGAPFTLASYMVEGGGSRNYVATKRLMYSAPDVWMALMEKICAVLEPYLKDQVAAGAEAIQLFDSWAGCLSPDDYRRYALPFSKRLIATVQVRGVPVIHFATGTAGMLAALEEAGADVLGIDWRVPIAKAWQEVRFRPAIQGNLDPVALFAPADVLRASVESILKQVGGRAGHIFNLGHGILPDTPVENVLNVVRWVHEFSLREEEGSPRE